MPDLLATSDIVSLHLLNLSGGVGRRLILSPHIAGITGASFRRSYAMMWDDISAVMAGHVPRRVVNPW